MYHICLSYHCRYHIFLSYHSKYHNHTLVSLSKVHHDRYHLTRVNVVKGSSDVLGSQFKFSMVRLNECKMFCRVKSVEMFQGVDSSGPGLQLNATSSGTGAFIRVTIQILRDQGYNINSGWYVQQNLEPVVRCIEGSERSCWILQWADLWKNKVQVNQWPGARVNQLSCFNVPMLEPKSGNLRVKTIMFIDQMRVPIDQRMSTVQWSSVNRD